MEELTLGEFIGVLKSKLRKTRNFGEYETFAKALKKPFAAKTLYNKYRESSLYKPEADEFRKS
jgi:hypothetical protein